MATVHVTLGRVGARADTGSTLPILSSAPRAAETISSISEASTVGALTGSLGEIWSLTARSGDVFVSFGLEPEEGVSSLLLSGHSRDFSVTVAGEKVAVIDA